MKRLTAIICIVAMLCAVVLPVNAVTPKTKEADIFDVLEILKNIVGMPNDAFEITGIEKPDIFDALAMLKGIVGMGEVVVVNVVGAESTATKWESKVYSTATLEDNFCGETVLVLLDKSISEPRKIHAPSFFGDFPIKEIIDLTWNYADIQHPWWFNPPPFRQSLSIKLPFDCKQNVLDVIATLEGVEGIISAEVNGFGARCLECFIVDGACNPGLFFLTLLTSADCLHMGS
ncbi:MAG: hypothetical protein FWH07_07360 [Oscillospiraceae bacterium]|nr:hypothetical protein [Oscillospiraceae bacterium]